MSYSKLYSSIVHSSLWTEPDHIRLLFITLLAIADREGYVYGSRKGLLRLANLDPDQCAETDPFNSLIGPDKDSSDLLRNPENEGRRIEEVPGGFRLLNFAYYRGIFDAEDRREQNRIAQAKHREKIKEIKDITVSKRKHASAKVSTNKPSEAEAAPAPAPAPAPEKKVTNVTFLDSLKKDSFLAGVNIDQELLKAKRWCKSKNRKCTERFFRKWLERADRIVPDPTPNSTSIPSGHNLPPPQPTEEEERQRQKIIVSQQVKNLAHQFRMHST